MLRRIARASSIVILGLSVGVLGISLVWRFVISPPVEAEIEPASGKVIQLRILNGAGVPELARQVQHYLRRRGFDVVDAANASTMYEHSVVLDHLGDSLATARVCYALGIAPESVRMAIDSDLVLHCSVVIGQDWHQLRPFR
jgi:hypothetical protein